MRRRTTSWTPLASEADEPHRGAARAYSAYLNMPVVPVSGGGQADPRDDAGSYTRASRGAAPRGARGVGAGARGPRMRLPARFSLHDSLGALFMRCRQHSRVPCHTILSCGERGIACGILQGQSYRRFLPDGRPEAHSIGIARSGARRRSREPTQEARHSISKVVMSKAKVIESSHPLILHKITQMRKVRSPMAVCEPRSTPSAVTQRIRPANSAL